MEQQAIVQDASGYLKVVDNVPVPTLSLGTVLGKTQAVALQPADYKINTPIKSRVAKANFIQHGAQVDRYGQRAGFWFVADLRLGSSGAPWF